MTKSNKTVSFRQMKDCTSEDYALLDELEKPFVAGTADRLIKELAAQADETLSGFKITRLEHGLQAATRACRDGADLDWIVGALLHDIGDRLAPQNHDRMAAEILRPYVREEVAWVVEPAFSDVVPAEKVDSLQEGQNHPEVTMVFHPGDR